jgi:hypothetical protein
MTNLAAVVSTAQERDGLNGPPCVLQSVFSFFEDR